MKTKLRKTRLIALGIVGVASVSGLSSGAAESPPVATKTDRLQVTANSGAGYVTVQSPRPGASVLCRLPIQIANWNIGRPPRCN